MTISEKRFAESNTRTIDVTNDYIIYTLKLDGVQDYLTMDETLLDILQKESFRPFRDNGRLRIKVRNNGADFNMYLYDLAVACYSGMVKPETFLEDMQAYFEYKSFNDLSIDHADNNIINNTCYNLSFMERQLNCKKGACVARVKEPIYLNSAYVNGKYRVQLMTLTTSEVFRRILDKFGLSDIIPSDGLAASHFLCENAEDYCDCLNMIVNSRFEWAEPLKDGNGHWIKNNNPCWSSDISHSLHAQKMLAMMKESAFSPYEKCN